MLLKEALSSATQTLQADMRSVPEWMIGAFKRQSISFANGQCDKQTRVFWLQSRGLTVDLRLPIESEQVPSKHLDDYSKAELQTLANYEGWSADSLWENQQLSWSGGTSFQLHNRWPEPAQLKRVGDCMIEFAPSGAYVEDWRLLSCQNGPLVGLRLIDEINLTDKRVTHLEGALIINGDWAGLVLGRPSIPPNDPDQHQKLRDIIANVPNSHHLLFNFETSVAQGNLEKGFQVAHSTQAHRLGESLFELDGFEWDEEEGILKHHFCRGNTNYLRRYQVDSINMSFPYSSATEQTPQARDWFLNEQTTLGRYLA